MFYISKSGNYNNNGIFELDNLNISGSEINSGGVILNKCLQILVYLSINTKEINTNLLGSQII